MFLVDGMIITMNDQNTIIKKGFIKIEGKHIVMVSDKLLDYSILYNEEVIDCKGKMIIPGLINMHTHSNGWIMKGLIPEIPLQYWIKLARVIRTYLTPKEIYISALLACAEMLKNGVTSFVDHIRQDIDGLEKAVEAYADSGMRVFMAPMVYDLGYPECDNVSDNFSGKSLGFIDLVKECYTRWQDLNGRLKIFPGPSAIHRCSDALLYRCIEFSTKYNLPIHTHLAETKLEEEFMYNRCGCNSTEYLNRKNMLSDRWTFAHCIWLDNKEIDLLGIKNVNIVLNPLSNFILGSGIPSVHLMKKANVNLTVGTDGVNTGGTLSLLENLRLLRGIDRIFDKDYKKWFTSLQSIAMITRNSAKALYMEKLLGSIEEGKLADITIIDTKSLTMCTTGDLVNSLIMNDTGLSVDKVIIDGRIIYQNNRILSYDVDNILEEARLIMKYLGKLFL